jgi:hypothetical protein
MKIEQTTISSEEEPPGTLNKNLIFTTMKMLEYGWVHHLFNWEVDSSKTSQDSILQWKVCTTTFNQMIIVDKGSQQKVSIHLTQTTLMNRTWNKNGHGLKKVLMPQLKILKMKEFFQRN